MPFNVVYKAQNRCRLTGLERVLKAEVLPDGSLLQVFADNFQQYRAVLFKTAAHDVGFSGVLIGSAGNVLAAETVPALRPKASTYEKHLLAYLVTIGIKVENSA